jgi:hypothetical protein
VTLPDAALGAPYDDVETFRAAGLARTRARTREESRSLVSPG